MGVPPKPPPPGVNIIHGGNNAIVSNASVNLIHGGNDVIVSENPEAVDLIHGGNNVIVSGQEFACGCN